MPPSVSSGSFSDSHYPEVYRMKMRAGSPPLAGWSVRLDVGGTREPEELAP